MDNSLKLPTKEEILQEMELHNQDESGINNQWSFEDAEYHLLLSDKYSHIEECYKCHKHYDTTNDPTLCPHCLTSL